MPISPSRRQPLAVTFDLHGNVADQNVALLGGKENKGLGGEKEKKDVTNVDRQTHRQTHRLNIV